jgi:hypothetical protein
VLTFAAVLGLLLLHVSYEGQELSVLTPGTYA